MKDLFAYSSGDEWDTHEKDDEISNATSDDWVWLVGFHYRSTMSGPVILFAQSVHHVGEGDEEDEGVVEVVSGGAEGEWIRFPRVHVPFTIKGWITSSNPRWRSGGGGVGRVAVALIRDGNNDSVSTLVGVVQETDSRHVAQNIKSTRNL